MLLRHHSIFFVFTFFLSTSVFMMNDSYFSSPEMQRRSGGVFYHNDVTQEVFSSTWKQNDYDLERTFQSLAYKARSMRGYGSYITIESIKNILQNKEFIYSVIDIDRNLSYKGKKQIKSWFQKKDINQVMHKLLQYFHSE